MRTTMSYKIQGSRFFNISLSPVLFLAVHFVFDHAMGVVEETNSEQMLSVANNGVVQDLNSPLGTITNLCIEMAVSDFYSAHPNYKTRLRLHTRDVQSPLDVDFAVLELLEHEQVDGILGPGGSSEEIFVAELGSKVQVPIISFTARSSALSNAENHYFVRTAIDDAVQAQALAAIFKGFGWTQVVILYEDTEYGYQFLSHVNKAFQDDEIGLAHVTPISRSAKNNDISKELSILNRKQTRVFLVHMNPSLGFRLFTIAKKIGMVSEGYAWIITDSLSNFLSSMDSVTRETMEGVVGIRPYVSLSNDLENFRERWTKNTMILKKNNTGPVMDLNIYGLWAYDTITALAIAVEKIGQRNSSSLYVKTTENGTKNINLRTSLFGPQLLRELARMKFRGVSGEFQLLDGTLKPSAFEIFNVIGTGERRVGFWTPERGIIRELRSPNEVPYSTSTKELKRIMWPGDSVSQPKGWAIPTTGSLRIGVPWIFGYEEFINASIDPATNRTHPTGFAIDIFLAASKELPFSISYEFYYYNGSGNINWTYDDMLREIPQKFDMVVGDTTIWAPRASYVDFSLPYSESGVVLVVKNKRPFDIWIFTKPLRWDLWMAIAITCIFTGIVIWILERQRTNPVPGEESAKPYIKQPGMMYLAPITILAFQERNMVSNNSSFLVLVVWLFMAFILMQSYTANLSAILTVDQLKFAFSDNYYVGFQEGSFMKEFLTKQLNISASRLRGYSSPEEYHNAMSLGSKNGGIDAIFDEIPYMKLFLKKYDSQYKMVGPTYRTDGLGFAFPIGSPLVAYFSRAILNVTQGPEMTSIERQNFGPGYSSQDPLSSTVSQGTSSLTFHDFAGLFLIVGSVTLFAIFWAEIAIFSKLTNVIGQFLHNWFYLKKTKKEGSNGDVDTTNGEENPNVAATSFVEEDRGEQHNREQEPPIPQYPSDDEIVDEANAVQDAGGDINNGLQKS